MSLQLYRTIDANINRICEGLRVTEDILRFEFNWKELPGRLKKMRHFFREGLLASHRGELLNARDSLKDPGRALGKVEMNRTTIYDLLKANILRAEEGIRVLEEVLKLETVTPEELAQVKSYRFELYQLEKEILLSPEIISKVKK